MSTIALPDRIELSSDAGVSALNFAVRAWMTVAVIGQWLFFYYLVRFYGPSTFTGHFEVWKTNKMLPKGYVPGDTAGNIAFAAHALLAAVIAFGGALQLIPQLRKRAMKLHRWNGRVFIVTALFLSISGLYMVWIRNAHQSNGLGVSLNAVLIIAFGLLAWRTAVKHDAVAHREWALRTYLMANGQWFTRVGFFAWAILMHGRYMKQFFVFWAYGSYLLPLAILELYLSVKRSDRARERYAMSAALVVLTLLTALGIFGASIFHWKQILSRL